MDYLFSMWISGQLMDSEKSTLSDIQPHLHLYHHPFPLLTLNILTIILFKPQMVDLPALQVIILTLQPNKLIRTLNIPSMDSHLNSSMVDHHIKPTKAILRVLEAPLSLVVPQDMMAITPITKMAIQFIPSGADPRSKRSLSVDSYHAKRL
jgi:hypothetical protein